MKNIPKLIIKTLIEAGITEYELEHGKKHPKIRFTHCGKRGMVVICGSAGDHRSHKNDLKYLRREIAKCASN